MYIIGLDVSSTRIGIAVLGSNDEIELSKVIKLKSSLTLEQRAGIFESEMRKLEKKYVPMAVYMEAPAMLFRGGQLHMSWQSCNDLTECAHTSVIKFLAKRLY